MLFSMMFVTFIFFNVIKFPEEDGVSFLRHINGATPGSVSLDYECLQGNT